MSGLNPDSLTAEIVANLQKYNADITEGIRQIGEEVATELQTDLQTNSPKQTGEYAKGWKIQKNYEYRKVKFVVHNSKKPWLTHLLENGHAIRNGSGRVRAFPHIAPAEQRAVKEFEKKVEELLKNAH